MLLAAFAFLCVAMGDVVAELPVKELDDTQVTQALREFVGEEFRILRTDHFTIAYDTPYPVLRALIGRLEGTYDTVERFCEGEGLSPEPLKKRLGVVLFGRHADFARKCRDVGMDPASVSGFFDHGKNIALFGNVLDRPEMRVVTRRIDELTEELTGLRRKSSGQATVHRRREKLRRELRVLRARRDSTVETFNRLIIRHEATHQILFNSGVHIRGAQNPDWLVEGLACQFEVPQSWSSRGLGHVNHRRLLDFRQALGVGGGDSSIAERRYRKAVGAGKVLTLVDLIGNADVLRRGGPNTAYHYAQAWSLVYYLHRKHRGSLAAYTRLVSGREPGRRFSQEREIGDFESTIGPIDDELLSEWLEFILSLKVDVRKAGD